MAAHEHEHCQICGADFESHSDLLEHTRKEHAQTGTPWPSAQADGQEDSASKPRKNRQFTRSHRE